MECPYLVTLESLDATSSLWSIVWVDASWRNQFPHLDGLVQTSRDEILSVWCKGDGIDGIFVAVGPLKALNKISRLGIPNTNALIERTSCDVFGVG